jgi:hypothetical protein
VTADFKQTLDEIPTEIDYLHGCGEMPGVPRAATSAATDAPESARTHAGCDGARAARLRAASL